MNQPPAPQQQPQPPPPQLALPAPPPITQYFGDFMRGLAPQEYTPMRPDSRFQEPNMSFDDGIDLNDTFYKALPEDKKEEYQIARLEDIAKNIDETAEKAVEDIEKTDFYTKLDVPTQEATKEKAALIAIQQKLEQMKGGSIKGLGTKDVNALKEPRYPQNKIYRNAYTEGLTKQEDTIKKRIAELEAIISSTKTKSGEKKRSEAEKIVKENDLTKIETLYNKLKQEKKRIKDLLK
jgi:type II secretory pathway pseudopilin PulG